MPADLDFDENDANAPELIDVVVTLKLKLEKADYASVKDWDWPTLLDLRGTESAEIISHFP